MLAKQGRSCPLAIIVQRSYALDLQRKICCDENVVRMKEIPDESMMTDARVKSVCRALPTIRLRLLDRLVFVIVD
jgi:hypothetical protein